MAKALDPATTPTFDDCSRALEPIREQLNEFEEACRSAGMMVDRKHTTAETLAQAEHRVVIARHNLTVALARSQLEAAPMAVVLRNTEGEVVHQFPIASGVGVVRVTLERLRSLV